MKQNPPPNKRIKMSDLKERERERERGDHKKKKKKTEIRYSRDKAMFLWLIAMA